MLVSALLLGLLLGIRHAADPDHIATIASVVVNRAGWRPALRTALYWGIGHSITFFVVGLAVVLLHIQVPERFEQLVELLIGASLLLLGAFQLVNGVRNRFSDVPMHPSRPLALGGMHGLAGSAAIALLALTTVKSVPWALLYLVAFGVGSVAGMLLITALMAWSFDLSRSLSWARRGVVMATGAIGVACGALIAVEALTQA